MKMEIKKNILKENINNLNNLNEFLSHYDLQDFNTNIFVENAMEKMLGSNPNLSAKLLFIHLKSSYLMNGPGNRDFIIPFGTAIIVGLISPLLVNVYTSMSEREYRERTERRMQEKHESDLRVNNARIEKYNALTRALKQSELENNKSIISRTINYWYKPKDK